MKRMIEETRIFKWFRRKIVIWAFKYIEFVETKQIYHKGNPDSIDPYDHIGSRGIRFRIILIDKEPLILGKYTLFREE